MITIKSSNSRLVFALVPAYVTAPLQALWSLTQKKAMRVFKDLHSIWLLLLGLITLMQSTSLPATAQQNNTTMGIAAVVNEDIVTVFDVQSRLGLFLVTAGIQNTPDVQRRLLPQVVDALIEERLKIQEALRLEIATTEEEISNAVAMIEARNGMQPGAFRTLLKEQRVNIDTFYGQVEADVAWSKVVRDVLERDVNIAPEEVDTVLDKLRSNQGKLEYRVAEIYLPVSPVAREQNVRELANELVERARSNSSFPALAQQFSQSATAAVGGDLGWVLPGELDRELERVISRMTPDQISNPVRTTTGYHILQLQDQRASGTPNPMKHIIELSQIYLPTLGGRSLRPDRLAQFSERIQTRVANCEQMNRLAEEIGGPGSGQRPLLYAGILPEKVRNVVINLPPERVSPPIEITGARLFIIVCQRQDDTGLPTPGEVYAQLENDKLQSLARQKLRDLRRQALIDIRL